MSDNDSEQPPEERAADGEESPSADVPVPVDRDDELQNGLAPGELPEDIVARLLPIEDPETLQIVTSLLRARSAPLPSAEELAQYDRVVPGLAQEIRYDFVRQSEIAVADSAHLRSVTDREMSIQEREQELRVLESSADIKSRWISQVVGAVAILLAFVGAIWTLGFAPIGSDVARAWVAVVWLIIMGVIGVAVIMRGRHSDNERDVITDTLPRIAEALSQMVNQHHPSPRPPVDDKTPPNKAIDA